MTRLADDGRSRDRLGDRSRERDALRLRAEMNITMATEMPLVLVGVSAETEARAGRWI
jgi:hypothetical protein